MITNLPLLHEQVRAHPDTAMHPYFQPRRPDLLHKIEKDQPHDESIWPAWFKDINGKYHFRSGVGTRKGRAVPDNTNSSADDDSRKRASSFDAYDTASGTDYDAQALIRQNKLRKQNDSSPHFEEAAAAAAAGAAGHID